MRRQPGRLRRGTRPRPIERRAPLEAGGAGADRSAGAHAVEDGAQAPARGDAADALAGIESRSAPDPSRCTDGPRRWDV